MITAREGLTCRQARVLEAIAQYFQATGEICSVTFLARRLSLSRATVRDHLHALHRKGWLRTPTPSEVESLPHTRHF